MPRSPGVTKLRLSMLPLPPHETNPLRRGGPPRPPAQENITVGFCGDDCLAGNGYSLARWMDNVFADAAGHYKTTPVNVGIVSNPPRRGGPLCPPAHESITVEFCGDACLAVNGLPLARWMHPVRAEVAGCYAKFCLVFGLARLGGNASWKCGSTIPDGSSL